MSGGGGPWTDSFGDAVELCVCVCVCVCVCMVGKMYMYGRMVLQTNKLYCHLCLAVRNIIGVLR